MWSGKTFYMFKSELQPKICDFERKKSKISENGRLMAGR